MPGHCSAGAASQRIATPLSSQHTASPSIKQVAALRSFSASAMSGKASGQQPKAVMPFPISAGGLGCRAPSSSCRLGPKVQLSRGAQPTTWQVPGRRAPAASRGAYAIHVLRDLCLKIKRRAADVCVRYGRTVWPHSSPAFHFASGKISGASLPWWVQGSTVQSSLVLRSLITAVLCGPSVIRNRDTGAAIVWCCSNLS